MDASAQYVIDIASRMTGAETTTAQLDALTKELSGSGRGAEHFQIALQKLDADLATAKVETIAANDALAAGSAEYRILETAVAQAAKAAERASVATRGSVPPELSASLDTANAALRVGAREYGALERAAARAAAAVAASASKSDGVASPESLARLAAANDALGAGKAKYGDLQVAAAQAAAAVDDAAAASAAAQRALSADQLNAANAALQAQADKLAGLEGAASAAARKEQELANSISNVRKLGGHVDKTLAQNSEQLSKVQGALGQVGGPLGKLGQLAIAPTKGFADLSQVLGKSNAAMLVAGVGIAAVVAAVVALTVAVVASVVKVAAWGIELADAARKAGLAQEAAEALDPSLYGLRDTMSAITDETGVTGDSLRELAGSLKDAKVSADDMPAALHAAALAEAALGQGGASSFIADMKAGKLSVAEFAASTQEKLGGVVARQLLGLEAQGNRFKSNIASLFGGLDIDPALGGLQTLVGLFDKGSASGSALKTLFEGIFQPFIDKTQAAAYVVEAFVLGVEIGLVKLYIKVKPMLKSIGELLGFDDTSFADVLTGAKKAGEFLAPVLLALGVAFGAVAAVVAVAIGIVVAIPVVFAAIPFAIAKAGKAVWAWLQGPIKAIDGAVTGAIAAVRGFGAGIVGAVTGAFRRVSDFVASFSLVDAAVGLVSGIASGIASGASAVLGAIKSIMGSVLGALGLGTWAERGSALLTEVATGITGAVGAVLTAIGGAVTGALGVVTGTDWLGLGASVIASIASGVTGAIAAVGAAFGSVVASARELLGNVAEWLGLGDGIVSGIVSGITGGAGRVVGAVADMAKGAISKAKSVLGIASPSKVFGDMGDNTVEGYVNAVDAGAGDAQQAMADMVAPPANDNTIALPGLDVPPGLATNDNAAQLAAPTGDAMSDAARVAALSGDIPPPPPPPPADSMAAYDALAGAPAPAPAPAPAAGSGGKASIDLSGATFNFYGVEGAEDAERRFGDLLTSAIEGDAEALGKGRAA